MANLILSRPQAQVQQTLSVPPGSRLVLDFPTDQATLERTGDNLAFSFEDGSRIGLTNFYNEYSRADLPDFEVNGELMAGEKFFEVFAPDLLLSAGPARAARETHAMGLEDGGALMHGLDHLDGLNGSQVAPTAPESGPAPVSSPLGRGFNESGGDFAESAGPGESGGSGGEPESGPYLQFVEKNADPVPHIAEGEVSIDPVLHGNLASVFRFGGLEQGGSLRLDVPYTDGKGGAHNYVFTWSDGTLSVADAQGNVVDPDDLPFGIEVAGGLASFYKVAGIDPETGDYIYNQSHVLDVSATLTGPDGAQLQSGPHRLEADGALTAAQGAPLEPDPYNRDPGVSLAGGASTDYMVGGDHSDLLEGGLAADKLYGGAGNDTLIGSWKMEGLSSGDFTVKSNLLDGGSGNDILAGAILEKHSPTGEPVHLMTGGTLSVTGNTLLGGEGNDQLYGAQLSSNSSRYSTTSSLAMGGDAQLTVSGNTLDGGAGDDQLYGAQLSSNSSSNSSSGYSSNSSAMSSDAQMTVSGNTLDGGAGDDMLFGAHLSATATTTGGGTATASALRSDVHLSIEHNVFDGGDGNDMLFGAHLSATATTRGDGTATASALEGKAHLSITNNTFDGGGGSDQITGLHIEDDIKDHAVVDFSHNQLLGGDGDDVIRVEDIHSNYISPDAVLHITDNYLDGGAGADTIIGGRGTDIIAYDETDAQVNGGDGTDILLVGGDDLNTLFGTGPGALGQTVQSVEVVLSGAGAESLTDFAALEQHGIKMNDDGSPNLGDGWRQQAGAGHDGYDAWTNGDGLTVNVSEHTSVTHDAVTTPDPAAEAAMKMAVENS